MKERNFQLVFKGDVTEHFSLSNIDPLKDFITNNTLNTLLPDHLYKGDWVEYLHVDEWAKSETSPAGFTLKGWDEEKIKGLSALEMFNVCFSFVDNVWSMDAEIVMPITGKLSEEDTILQHQDEVKSVSNNIPGGFENISKPDIKFIVKNGDNIRSECTLSDMQPLKDYMIDVLAGTDIANNLQSKAWTRLFKVGSDSDTAFYINSWNKEAVSRLSNQAFAKEAMEIFRDVMEDRGVTLFVQTSQFVPDEAIVIPSALSNDLFESYEDLPAEVNMVLDRYSLDELDYKQCESLLAEMESLGYTFEFGLDASPYGLKEMNSPESTPKL